MRPQFGSLPFHEHFTSFEFATARATRSASRFEAAPRTWTSTSFVTRSPSETMRFANSSITSVRASRNSALPSPPLVIVLFPAWPFAMTMTVSFVLMSPSTVMRLKERSTASFVAATISALETAASVVTKHSIVAMCGLIMPAPFAMAPMRTRTSPIFTCTAISFGRVSLVMMARAAASPSQPNEVASSGMRGSIRSIGRGTPMIPVEQTCTSRCLSPSALAVAAVMARALRRPSGPVHAFALPLLAMMARGSADFRWLEERRTGAAQTWFCV